MEGVGGSSGVAGSSSSSLKFGEGVQQPLEQDSELQIFAEMSVDKEKALSPGFGGHPESSQISPNRVSIHEACNVITGQHSFAITPDKDDSFEILSAVDAI